MRPPKEIRALESRIGYQFKDWTLLRQAVTHPSAGGGNNQRLEFLGDRVLALVVSENIMREDPEAPPGKLSVRLSSLVSRPSCARIAAEIGLADAVRIGKSAKPGRAQLEGAILGDAIEAVIAAVYLDGGLTAAREVIGRIWAGLMAEVPEASQDPKSRLQIWAQARRQPPPQYRLRGRSGPDHHLLFEVEVHLESGEKASGQGRSKQAAELAAAKTLLHRIEPENG
ncbi:MAG: ribonuclease III [Rhodobacteraceae bacterium]|nr:ribonuclease III [Paracoccaceae bacterium]